jgi:HAD superfamily hydrolase (TIGR01509 family)
MLHPRALLLDMDGLMVDSEPLWFEVEGDFARSRGGDWSPELAHACIGRGLVHTLEVMHRAFGFDVDLARDGDDIVGRFIEKIGGLTLKPGCRELLDEARGQVALALASSSARRLVAAVVTRFELAQHFGAVVSGDDVAHPKPAPDIFLAAASRLGVAPLDCVVLEDSLAGATSGRSAGMRVIAVPERATPGMDLVADVVVPDLYAARREMTLGRPRTTSAR